jgi:hypothetical protein
MLVKRSSFLEQLCQKSCLNRLQQASYKEDSVESKSVDKENVDEEKFWYKGTPISDRKKTTGPNVYDPFERQNYLRSFPPRSDADPQQADPVVETERNNPQRNENNFYYPNYVPANSS